MYSYDRRYGALYGRLFLAMSMEDAKSVLGFPPGSNPSHSEIAKAYKAKVFENHPDRGGDPKRMVEINVAKDILEGKRREDRTPYTPPKEDPAVERRKKMERDLRTIDGAQEDTVKAGSYAVQAADLVGWRMDLEDFLAEEYADVLGKIHDDVDETTAKSAPFQKADQLCKSLSGLALRLSRKFVNLKRKHLELKSGDYAWNEIEALYKDTLSFINAFGVLYVESGRLMSLISTSEEVPLKWDDIYHRSHQIILEFHTGFKSFSDHALMAFKSRLEKNLKTVEEVLSAYGQKMPDNWDDWRIPGDFLKAASLVKSTSN